MPRVKMIITKKGSPNGIKVKEYEEGKEYLLPDSLADVFLDNGFAELVPSKPKVKAEPEAPMNKAEIESPINKSKSVIRREAVMLKSKLKRGKK